MANIKRSWMYFLVGAWTASLGAIAGTESDVRWRDESGTAFTMLPGLMTADQVDSACRERGMDVFNYEYLTPAEQQRFIANAPLKEMAWQRQYVGQASEQELAQVWGSSDAHGGRSVAGIFRYLDEKTPIVKTLWDSATTSMHNGVCMLQDHYWVSCMGIVDCHYGGSLLSWFITEYATVPSEGLVRVHKRFDQLRGDMACQLRYDVPYCHTVR